MRQSPSRVWECPGARGGEGGWSRGSVSGPSQATPVRLSGGSDGWAGGKVLKGPQAYTLPGSTPGQQESTETRDPPHFTGEGTEVQGVRVLAPRFTLGVEQLVRDSEPGPQSA